MRQAVPASEIVGAVNDVLSKLRAHSTPVTEDTPLASLDLESIDYIEVFILVEERTGAIFDLSVPPERLETVADLGTYRRVE